MDSKRKINDCTDVDLDQVYNEYIKKNDEENKEKQEQSEN